MAPAFTSPSTQPKLIGSIQVQPATARPGQSVLIQVLDANGHPYPANSGVTITINGVEAPARYCQFAQTGARPVAVLAAKGSIKEIATTTVQVAGDPMAYRLTIAPVMTAMPIIKVQLDPTDPYTAQLSLGTPDSVRRSLASKISFTTPAGNPAATLRAIAAPVATLSTLEDQVGKIVAGLPAKSVTSAAPTFVATTNGAKVSVVSRLAPISAATLISAPAGLSYQWDFGDGHTAATSSPNVTHNYFPAIKANQVAHSFNVKCTIVHDNISVTRTLVLHSAYGLCRSIGVAVPYVTGDAYAVLHQFFGVFYFSGSLIVHNPEPVATITLDQMAIVPVSSDRNAVLAAPKFTKMTTPVTIKANSSSGIGVSVLLSQLGRLGPGIGGFTVYYSGSLVSTPPAARPVPVRFSWCFNIRLTDSGVVARIPIHIPIRLDPAAALAAVAAASAAGSTVISKPGAQMIDPATNTIAIALSSDPHSATTKAQVRLALQAGFSVAKSMPAGISTDDVPRPGPPPPPPPSPVVVAGGVCDPDNISDADAAKATSLHLACQLTNQTTERSLPGSYQNAQMGDVLIMPGGDSPISQLLRGLNPPQHYAHSGIMTQNQVEITHCTAAEDRYGDYTTGIGGAGGIQPDVLQYGWPGCITQTLDNAIAGQNMKDPAGKGYKVGGFNAAPDPEFSMVPLLVIKPLPENEETARPILRKVAATARSKGAQIDSAGNVTFQKGACYYSFYCYTKPEVGAGFGDPAPASAGWAQGLTPTVCSGFIWLCMKENGVALVGPGKFESASSLSATALAGGAAVESTTLDGLFYYSQQERQQASQVLNTVFQNQIIDKEGVFGSIPFLGADIASKIADQIINMFAFGDPNMYGSSAWNNPGDGNAVSPDNMSWWNPPLFGYAEPVQYLQPHTEQYTTSVWTPYSTTGTVSGLVTLNGAPAGNVQVQVGGQSAVSGANGNYSIGNVPVGSYNLTASVVSGGIEYTNGLTGQPVQLTSAQFNVTVNVALQTLPDDFRDLVVVCQVTSCDHGDDNPFNTHGVQTGPTNTYHVPLGPGQIANSCSYSFDYNGGGYFTVTYQMNAVLAEDLSVEVTINASITNDGNGSPQNTYAYTFNVPKDTWYSNSINNFEATGTGYHNGPVNFTFTATNNQETS